MLGPTRYMRGGIVIPLIDLFATIVHSEINHG
jgi:hypothetical protein